VAASFGNLMVQRGMGNVKLASTIGEYQFGLTLAKGRAERSARGQDNSSLFNIKSTLIDNRKALQRAGVDDNIVSDFAYAVSAQQRNASGNERFPTDITGSSNPDLDFAAFSYYADAQGRIMPWRVGDAAPAGGILVNGKTAPEIFLRQYAQQFPQAQAASQALLDTLKQGNERVLGIEYSSGRITTKDFMARKKMPHYLPMRQIENTVVGTGPAAKGRVTKAQDPLAQWFAVSDARIDAAFTLQAVRSLGDALRVAPNPQFAVLNRNDVAISPVKPSENINMLELARADWTGKDTISWYEGNQRVSMTFTDKKLRDALHPDNWIDAAGARKALDTMQVFTRWSSFVKTSVSPAFLAAQVSWDTIVTGLNMQGAFSGKVARCATRLLDRLTLWASAFRGSTLARCASSMTPTAGASTLPPRPGSTRPHAPLVRRPTCSRVRPTRPAQCATPSRLWATLSLTPCALARSSSTWSCATVDRSPVKPRYGPSRPTTHRWSTKP
jgi:hypothetical protein